MRVPVLFQKPFRLPPWDLTTGFYNILCPCSQCFISHNLESESCLRSLEKPKPHFSTSWGQLNLCGRLFLHSNHGTFFAAYQACKGQKIILFRSTPQSSWYSWCLCQENVYFSLPLFTCQERTEEKKSWQSMGHPDPERQSHALA